MNPCGALRAGVQRGLLPEAPLSRGSAPLDSRSSCASESRLHRDNDRTSHGLFLFCSIELSAVLSPAHTDLITVVLCRGALFKRWRALHSWDKVHLISVSYSFYM